MVSFVERIADRSPWPRGESGLCAWHPEPDLWYPGTETELTEAKRICGICSIRARCQGIGRAREEYGVWGGVHLARGKEAVLPSEKRRLERRRGRRRSRAANAGGT